MTPCDPRTGVDPDDWFADESTPAFHRAMTACKACPVMVKCGQVALAEGIPDGLFGGLTAEDRREQWHAAGGRPRDHMATYTDQVWRLQSLRAETELDLGLRERALRKGSAA